MDSSLKSIDEVVEEIMKIHKSLPPRPGIEELEAVKTLIQNVDKEEQTKLEAIGRQVKSAEIPDELWKVLYDMQKKLIFFQSTEQKKEVLRLLDLENAHQLFDELIQRALKCLPSASGLNTQQLNHSFASTSSTNSSTLSLTSPLTTSTTTSSSSAYYEKEPIKASELVTRDDTFLQKKKATFFADAVGARLRSSDFSTPQILDSSLKATSISGKDGEKLSLIKLISLIEVSSKKGTRDLNLQGKLIEQIEWLPDSIGKLTRLISLDLSENRIAVVPATIGGLLSLTKLDLHSNRISELPESIGDLLSLVFLDLRANQLTSLPATFGRLIRLEELDLSSNGLQLLPESIGSLASLKKLSVETNNIEEIPHTIGKCSSLKELRADYNRIKALPEAVGRIGSLEILSVRYNNIKQLATTMASLSSLRELDVSFNELESVPESLCFATTLVKMNVSNNFSDLQSLPRSIGNLEMLEELDISNNQIRMLPDSFRMLSQLRVLRLEGNPLEVPPRNVAEMGAQAVVEYMNELVAKRDVNSQPVRQKKGWGGHLCFFSGSNRRSRQGM